MILAALAIMLLATGCSKADQIVKEVEKAEKQVEEEGELTVTYDNGKEVTFSNKADIPDMFPSDVPFPDGIQVVSSIGSDRGVTVMFDTELPYDDVVELYVDYAQKAGYTELHRLEDENSIHYSSQRGTEIFAFHLQLSMEDNKTIEGAIDYGITTEPAQEEVEE